MASDDFRGLNGNRNWRGNQQHAVNEVITFEHISKSIGSREILKDINMAVNQGDIFGFLGPNGAGKTTTIRIALGLLHPTSGKALVFGRNPEEGGVRTKIGAVLDVDGLYNDMCAYDNLAFYASLYELPDANERINQNLKLAELSDRKNDKVSSYSKGMRQRLSLARTLLHDPELLVLDEPTAGVDPSGQIEIRQMLLDMAHQQGKTVFFSSHNLDEVQRICNRIALIHNGEIRLSGELAQIERGMSHGTISIETLEPIPNEVIALLNGLPGVSTQSQEKHLIRLTTSEENDIPRIVHLLDTKGARILQVKKQEPSLEEIYSSVLKEAEAG